MSDHTFLATSGRGLARATQTRDAQWTVDFLVTDQDVRCLAVDPFNPDTVYAGTQGNGMLRSDDRGETWQPAGLNGSVRSQNAVWERADWRYSMTFLSKKARR